MIALLAALILTVGRGEACKAHSDCDKRPRHLICVEGSCQIGCLEDRDCPGGGWCRAVPFESHKQCVKVDPFAVDHLDMR